MSTQNQAVQQRKEAKHTVKSLLEGEAFKQAVQKALPKHVTADRFVRVALTATLKTPKLLECSQESLFNSLLTLSQFGLEPDGRHAHLIPYGMQCQVIIDYKGLVALAMRTGTISFIHADVVCENDEFVYSKGELKEHKIDFRKPRGAIYAFYSLVRNKDGTESCQVMTREEVDSVRARSRAADSGPWVTDYAEMGKKSIFRRHSKWLELSAEFRDALEVDSDKIEDDRFKAAKPAIVAPSETFLPPAAQTVEAETFDPSTAQGTDVPAEPASERPKEPPVTKAEVIPQDVLVAQMKTILDENAITSGQFLDWLGNSGMVTNGDSIGTIEEVPGHVLNKLIRSKAGLVTNIKGLLK